MKGAQVWMLMLAAKCWIGCEVGVMGVGETAVKCIAWWVFGGEDGPLAIFDLAHVSTFEHFCTT